MSIQSEINRIKTDKESLITNLKEKGVQIADGATLGDISLNVKEIESGGGGGGNSGGFSVTFPTTANSNYENWSQFKVAYIVKSDGTVLDIKDQNVVAGKTIDGVILFTAGDDGYWGLWFEFKGKVTLYSPFFPTLCLTYNDTTVTNTPSATLHTSQFFIPNSDLTISYISAYNVDY